MSQTRVLVADDSVTIQKVFELAFENEDIEVALANDGVEALEKIKQFNPAMVIADVNMPGMNGFDLCRELKKDPQTAGIPLYLMSSALDEFDEDLSEEVGAAGRFEKPFRSEDMVRQVRAVISSMPPAAPEKDEDTFDDVDVALDALMDSVDQDEDALEEVVVSEENHVDEWAEEGITHEAMDDAPSMSDTQILELESAAIVIDEPEEDDDLAVEVVSGQSGAEEPEDIEDAEPIAEEGSADNRPVEITSVETEAPDTFGDDVAGEAGLDDSDLTEDGRRMLEAVDKDIEQDQAQPERELHTARVAGEAKRAAALTEDLFQPDEDSGVGAPAVESASIADAIRGAVESLITNGQLQSLIEDAVERSVKESLSQNQVGEAVSRGVATAIENMKPQILDDIRSIAREMTLTVAENQVKSAIEEIKSGD